MATRNYIASLILVYAFTFLIIICVGTLLGCGGEVPSKEMEVIANLPNSADISRSSIGLPSSINPRREVLNGELSLDELSKLINIFGKPERSVVPLKWERSGRLIMEVDGGDEWQITFFLVGKSFYYRINDPKGVSIYYKSLLTAEEFNNELRLLFE